MAKAKKDAVEMDGNQFPEGFNFADLKSIISEMEDSKTDINVSHLTFTVLDYINYNTDTVILIVFNTFQVQLQFSCSEFTLKK